MIYSLALDPGVVKGGAHRTDSHSIHIDTAREKRFPARAESCSVIKLDGGRIGEETGAHADLWSRY